MHNKLKLVSQDSWSYGYTADLLGERMSSATMRLQPHCRAVEDFVHLSLTYG